MPDNILFYLVFLSQIFLISYYFPQKLMRRFDYVFSHYPPETHPKLYPQPKAKMEQGVRRFWLFNRVILLIGLALLGYFALLAPTSLPDGMSLLYGFCQFVPFSLMELSGMQQFKLMRQINQGSSRNAELQPRALFDFISPWPVVLAAVLMVACVVYDLYMPNFRVEPDVDTLVIAISLLLCNLLFGWVVYWNLHGKKINPLQSHKDRIRQISVTVKSLTATSIAVSVFLIATITVESFKLDNFEFVLNSLYWQMIALLGIGIMLGNIKLEDIDFDVYKADEMKG